MNMHIKENNKFITPNVIFFVAEKYKITLAKIKKMPTYLETLGNSNCPSHPQMVPAQL